MIKNISKVNKGSVALLLGVSLLLVGCQREELAGELGSCNGLLKFRVAGFGVKGALINNEDQMLAAGVDSFMVEAWNGDCTKFVQLQKVSYDKEAAEWQTAKSIDWKGGDKKTFFAYTNLPESGATVVNKCESGSPAVRKQTLTYTLPLDARKQNDIMLGWYEGGGDGETTATITFVHPLSSIKLVRGAMNVDSIQSITISGLYASGSVDVTYTTDDGGKVVPNYSWGDTRTGSVLSTLGPEDSLEIADDGTIGTPFIVIPQDVAEGQVKITVTAIVDGKEKNLVAKLPECKLESGQTKVVTLNPEYIATEYICTSDNAYINTGVEYSDDNSYVIEYNAMVNSYSQTYEHGALLSGWDGGAAVFITTQEGRISDGMNNGDWDARGYIVCYTTTINSGSESKSTLFAQCLSKGYQTDYTRNKRKDILSYAIAPYQLGCGSTQGNEHAWFTNANFYYCRIKVNGILVRDLIPVYNLKKKAYGMYDKVGGDFYGNANSIGSITGPAIN